MIELHFLTQEINKKFQNEIWADYESKLFGNNLFIKCGINLSYSHQFELYIEHANIENFIDKWTVDLRKNKILYFENKEICFVSDEDEMIRIKGKRYFINLLTTIYHDSPSHHGIDYMINPSLLDLSTVENMTPNDDFMQFELT